MDLLQAAADHCIRRALGFVGLGVGMVMLSLSFDLPLALRAGADLLALACAVLVVTAWRTPHSDLRRSETWTILQNMAGSFASRLPRSEIQALLSRVLRSRLIWHAERIAAVAAAMWVLALGIETLRP